MNFEVDDYVRIVEREQTSADIKNGTFYPFYCGLEGRVDKVYGDEVSVRIDLDTLPKDMLKRHTDIQESMKKKWLDGLSNEARNRLTAQDKQFHLTYTLLVQASDLEKAVPGDDEKKALKGRE